MFSGLHSSVFILVRFSNFWFFGPLENREVHVGLALQP